MDHNFYKNYFEFEKYHWWFRVRRNIVLLLLEKYKIREHKVSAVLSDNIIPGSMLMASDLWTKDNKGHIRHDSDKVAEILKKIFETNLKN